MSMQRFGNAVLMLCVFAATLLAAESPFVGTWKMNADKSKLTGGDTLQNVTVTYEMDGNTLKASVQGTDPQGQPASFTYEAAMDGKPGTATGSPTFDAISLQRVNAHTLKATAKKDGKVVYTDRRVVSGDGKMFTIFRTGTDAKGQKYHNTIVFDKQ